MKRAIAFDTETELIAPAHLAPRMVCLSWQCPGDLARLAHHTDSEGVLRQWLEDPESVLVGQNVAFDMGVIGARFPDLIPLIFAAYEADRVTDTKIRQQLLDIADGIHRGKFVEGGKWVKHGYALDDLSARHRGFRLKKDGWRMFYGEFIDVPLEEWPAHALTVQEKYLPQLAKVRERDRIEAKKKRNRNWTSQEQKDLTEMIYSDPEECVQYPLEDARATLEIFQKQEVHADPFLKDQFRQARAAWWLHLSSAWGIRTRMAGVEHLRADTERAYEELRSELVEAGLVRQDGSRDTKAAAARMVAVCERDGLPVRHTPADGVSLDADACEASEDEVLKNYAELGVLKAVLSKDVPMLAAGTMYPIHTRYDLAETGRTTASAPNIQNLRRKIGIREAFVPREGKVFAQADFPQLELYALAQVCYSRLGTSALGDALNAGLDPHTAVAAQILGISYEEAVANRKRKDVDDARQVGKVFNFGKPGGLGTEKLILFARKTYNVELTHERVKALTDKWFVQWPEMKDYFALINELCSNGVDGKLATVESLFTDRIRGGATYCAACNNGFQALGSDAAKRAGWLIAKACYTDRSSPLFGSRTVAFVHDEFLVETDDHDRAHDVAQELAKLMVQGANEYLPDVPIVLSKMEPLLMAMWSKKAEPVYDANKRLVPWSPPETKFAA